MATAENLSISRFEVEKGHRVYGLIDPRLQARHLQASPAANDLENFRNKFKAAADTNGWCLYTSSRLPRHIRLDNYPEGSNEVFSIVKPVETRRGMLFCVCIDMLINKDDGRARVEIHHSEEHPLSQAVIFEPEIGSMDIVPGYGNDRFLFIDVAQRAEPAEQPLAPEPLRQTA